MGSCANNVKFSRLLKVIIQTTNTFFSQKKSKITKTSNLELVYCVIDMLNRYQYTKSVTRIL